jgi:hypothetical protein
MFQNLYSLDVIWYEDSIIMVIGAIVSIYLFLHKFIYVNHLRYSKSLNYMYVKHYKILTLFE